MAFDPTHEKEALQRCGFVEADGEGNLIPKFDMLVPVLDENGVLKGLAKPGAFRLLPKESEIVLENVTETVAVESKGE